MGPDTLQDAVLYFASPDNCREYLVAHRWADGVTCPSCGGKKVLFQAKYNRWQCGSKHPLRQFTSKTGTIFEDSPLGLDKWLVAMWQIVNCKNGVSSYEVHRAIKVTQKTAWFMDHRIRLALGMVEPEKLSGEIEADETFVGGKLKNMHKSKRDKLALDGRKRRGMVGKAIVSGLLERNTKQARVKVLPYTRQFHRACELRHETTTRSARTRQHRSGTHEQRSPHGTDCLKKRLTESRRSPETR